MSTSSAKAHGKRCAKRRNRDDTEFFVFAAARTPAKRRRRRQITLGNAGRIGLSNWFPSGPRGCAAGEKRHGKLTEEP
jgi:hypothetical protein